MHCGVKVWCSGTLNFPKKGNATTKKIKLATKSPFQNSLLNEHPGKCILVLFQSGYKASQRPASFPQMGNGFGLSCCVCWGTESWHPFETFPKSRCIYKTPSLLAAANICLVIPAHKRVPLLLGSPPAHFVLSPHSWLKNTFSQPLSRPAFLIIGWGFFPQFPGWFGVFLGGYIYIYYLYIFFSFSPRKQSLFVCNFGLTTGGALPSPCRWKKKHPAVFQSFPGCILQSVLHSKELLQLGWSWLE